MLSWSIVIKFLVEYSEWLRLKYSVLQYTQPLHAFIVWLGLHTHNIGAWCYTGLCQPGALSNLCMVRLACCSRSPPSTCSIRFMVNESTTSRCVRGARNGRVIVYLRVFAHVLKVVLKCAELHCKSYSANLSSSSSGNQ